MAEEITKISDFEDEQTLKYLKITDFENFFDIHQDKNDRYFYNLNSTLYFDVDENSLLEYTCTINMHWTLISYKLYGTTRLAWLLWKLNNISPADIFKVKHPGEKVKYLDKQYVEGIVADLNNFNE